MVDATKNIQGNEGDKKANLLSTKQGEKRIIEGYALKFGQRSKKLGNYYEEIAPGALNGVDLSDVKILVDHDFSKILGRTLSKTLKLIIDSIGLKFSVEIPNTSYANDLYESVNRGDISECSFGFTINEKDKNARQTLRLADGNYLRVVNKISRLSEISIVANPAYGSTSAQIKRDLEEAKKEYQKEKLTLELELLNS
ncbi:HK97 family phage prohead protease [Enterococcus sp. LJL99]